MKKLFLIFLVMFSCITLIAQKSLVNNSFEVSPTLQSSNQDPSLEAIWDLLLGFDVTALSGAAGNAGAEWDGTYLYSTRWASNLIHKYNATGTTMIEQFSIAGVTGLRDLAFDGTYMYGGAAANTIYQMDFVTKTLIGTIPSPVGVRFIAYDEASDAFWCGNWADPATLVSRTGTTLATITTGLAGQYGAAYDNISAGGPYLWIFDQGAGAGSPQIVHQFNISTGTATGVTHNVALEFPTAAGIAGGLFSMCDWQAGMFTLGGLLQGVPDNMFIYEITPCGPPCPVGQATNPNPVNGTTGVSINLAAITWTNGTGTAPTQIEVIFDGATVYAGAPVTSYPIPAPLVYSTTYSWKVNGSDGTCTTFGPTWTFTTESDPSIQVTTVHPQSVAMWTGTTAGTTKIDGEINTVFPNVGWAAYDVSAILPGAVVLDLHFYGYVNATYYPYWSATPMGTVNPITDPAAAINAQIQANSAQGVAYIYANEASTFAPGWHDYAMESGAISDFENALTQGWFAMGFIDRDLIATYYVNFDGWSQTNPPYIEVTFVPVPVELTSFTASANYGEVELSWITATETNNQGFEVQRSAGGEFEVIAFVEGHGTTTEIQAYSYIDRIDAGSYSYRLKQVDFDGSFEYSNVIEVDVPMLREFALDQNYPNPFNPSTKIAFRLAVDSKVSLKVFDVLGQEVATLVNTNLVAGAHNVDFNASSLNSGVYMYRIEATGIDGTNFTNVKKMILTK